MAAFNKGDQCVVIGNDHDVHHFFDIGEVVEFTGDISGSGNYDCRNNKGKMQFVSPNNLKLINQNNMEEFKITKERILAAADKCSTAKATLETMFPEAFEKNPLKNASYNRVGDCTLRTSEGTTILDWSLRADEYISLNTYCFEYKLEDSRLYVTKK